MNNPLETQVGGDHYKDLPIQPTEFCQRNRLGFCEANVVKYVTRHRAKGGREDLLKAIHYIEILIGLEYPDDEVPIITADPAEIPVGWWDGEFGSVDDGEYRPLKKGEYLREDDQFLSDGEWRTVEELGILRIGDVHPSYEPKIMTPGRRKSAADTTPTPKDELATLLRGVDLGAKPSPGPKEEWRMLVEGEDVIEQGDEYQDPDTGEWCRKTVQFGDVFKFKVHCKCRRRAKAENPTPDKEYRILATGEPTIPGDEVLLGFEWTPVARKVGEPLAPGVLARREKGHEKVAD